MAYPKILTSYHGGHQGSVSRIVIHGTVSPCERGGARANAHYFQTHRTGSAHYVVDPGEIIECVPEDVVAYHAPPNTGSIGIELCDPQTGSASRWGDANHDAMLRRAAGLVRAVAKRWNVPLKRIDAGDLRAGRHGVCGHADVTAAWHQTDHTDPGSGFPWGRFLALANGADPEEDDDMSERISVAASKAVTIPADHEWHNLSFDKVNQDSGGARPDDGDLPGIVDHHAWATLTMDGVITTSTPLERIAQVRFARRDMKKDKSARGWTWQEVIGTEGGTPITHTRAGMWIGPDEHLYAQVKNLTDEPIVVDGAAVQGTWKKIA